jgi:hypothetical protein|tara:strand:+ start:1069 stop:1260 length:192 start_codon:yes stop_codon:yes gene_type:complete
MDAILGFLSAGNPWVAAVTGIITASTAVTAITPTKSDDKAINFILKLLNLFAGNVLRNKNKDG